VKRSTASCVAKVTGCSRIPRSEISRFGALQHTANTFASKPTRSDRHSDCRKTRAVQSLLPLPGGEGRGEGEPNHKFPI
jgi:hypothetical protein